jgi:RimJ/RimL family protein N-acetyltransferase
MPWNNIWIEESKKGEHMLRDATMDDFESFYKIKSEDDNLYWCGYDRKPIKENLFKFWNKYVTENTTRTIFIISWGGKTVGYMYVDDDTDIEISIGISYSYTGQGLATKALGEVVQKLKTQNKNIIGYIREDNVKSQSVFRKVGFKITDVYRSMLLPTLEHEIKLYKWVYFDEEKDAN